MEFDVTKFAGELRARRARLDISQNEIAERTGIASATISFYESGKATPGVRNIFALCEALDCTPDELLCWPKTA